MSNPSSVAAARVPTSPIPFAGVDPAAAAQPTRHVLRFSEALAQLERHRTALRVALGVALATRLLVELHLVALVRESPRLAVDAPLVLAVLPYAIVLWLLAARTRDRFGFGMALAIGVLEVTYPIVALSMQRPLTFGAAWPFALVAVAHVPMVVTSLHVSTVFPPHDGKRPWILGFATALVLVALAWVSPLLLELARR